MRYVFTMICDNNSMLKLPTIEVGTNHVKMIRDIDANAELRQIKDLILGVPIIEIEVDEDVANKLKVFEDHNVVYVNIPRGMIDGAIGFKIKTLDGTASTLPPYIKYLVQYDVDKRMVLEYILDKINSNSYKTDSFGKHKLKLIIY